VLSRAVMQNWVLGSEGRLDMRRLLVCSLILHVGIFIVALVVGALSSESEPPVQERVVRLMLNKRVVSRKIVPVQPQESAAGRNKKLADQVFDQSFFKKIRKSLMQNRSRMSETAPGDPVSSRDRGMDKRYDRLQKSPDADHGRLNRSSSRNIDDYPGRRDLNKDTKTRDGNFNSLGRDGLTRTGDDRNPLRTEGTKRASRGNRGNSVYGVMNVRGRKVVYRPRIVLPAKYSRRGLSYTVRVKVTISPEGHVISAVVMGAPGDAELRRIIVQAARRYRLERGGSDFGMLVITIRPR